MAFDEQYGDELEATLQNVSRNCLRGQPIPEDLEVFWAAQLAEDTDFLDTFELTLFDAIDDDLFDGFGEEDGVEPALARAFRRMADQVCWIGEILDGSLIGYWVGEQNRPVADSPVVLCDEEGQFELGARTLSEYLLDYTDPEDPEEFAEVLGELEALNVHVRVRNHDDIWARLDGFDDPNSIVLGYVVEERMRG